MTRSLRWSVVPLSLVLVAAVSTPALAHAPTGGQDDDSGVPADLLVLDYEPFVLTLDDVRSVSGLARGEPFTSGEPRGFGVISGGNVPALCGEVAGRFEAGAMGDIRGAGASGVEVAVQNSIGGVSNAKETLAGLKALAKGCNAPYIGGATYSLTPAAQQPKVRKAGDGIVAFAATTSAPQAATFYQLYVREGRYFVSSLLLAFPGTVKLGRADLDRLAKRMGEHLADLEREFQRS
jgi:hypothetical protein